MGAGYDGCRLYDCKRKVPCCAKITISQGFKVLLDAIPSLLLIVIVIGGIIAGVLQQLKERQ